MKNVTIDAMAAALSPTRSLPQFLERNTQVKLHFTPTYSSWLNQVEIWFARLEREVIARGIFPRSRISRANSCAISEPIPKPRGLQMEILRCAKENPPMLTNSRRRATSRLGSSFRAFPLPASIDIRAEQSDKTPNMSVLI